VTLVVGSQRTPLAIGSAAALPSTAVGNKTPFVIEIDNIGNQTGTVSSINLVGSGMAQTQSVTLPAAIQPGASLAVNAVFAPTSLGTVNGYFQMQGQNYGLTATGATPAGLPAITFANVSPQMDPLLQPALGITFATPY